MKKHVLTICLTVISLLFASTLPAQETNEELSKRAANPLANLMSFPLQFNNDFRFGEFDRTRNVLNVQPVIPLAGGKIISRIIMPFVWLPDITAESGSFSSGLSDIGFTAFYIPGGETTWGFGPLIEFPTGGKMRGSQKWSLGPSVVALVQPGDWTFGILANNVWSVAGSSDRASVSKGVVNYFIALQLGNGWYVNSAPIITVNWKAATGQKWLVPFGVGGGKLVFFGGKLPVNFQTQVYFNVVKPDIGPDWQFRFQIQTLLPTGF